MTMDTVVHLSDLKPCPSNVIGPTWRRRRDNRWYLPERSLGWEALDWLATYVSSPGGEDDELVEGIDEVPFLPTPEQARFILWWYAVDATGKFAYRNGLLRRLKGWGKDPLVAAISLFELCGPSRFKKFHPVTGRPIGKRVRAPWIQIAAVSQTQTGNTLKLFPSMVSPKLKEEFKLEVLKTQVNALDGSGGLIQGVTSSPTTLEGGRPTFVVMNEVQWWIEANDGHDMYGVIEGNLTKSRRGTARYLAICNAHIPGQDSIGERMWDSYQAVQAGKAVDTGILYDSLEAPADTPVSEIPAQEVNPAGFAVAIEKLKDGIRIARGDSAWLDVDAIVGSILDVNNPITESIRKFLNRVNAAEDAWIEGHVWDSCVLDDRPLQKKDVITLGFDGSKSSDHTALVACRVEDGYLQTLKIWDPSDYKSGEIPREDVDAAVRWAFDFFRVVAMRADVREFESYIDAWSRDFKRTLKVKASPNNWVAFDMRGNIKKFALDAEKFEAAVVESAVPDRPKAICHGGEAKLRQHITAAHRYPVVIAGPQGSAKEVAISIRKPSKDSKRKIDAAVCAVLAYASRQDYLMNNKTRRSTVSW